MSSPFGKNVSPANKVKRNTFDLSRSSNVSLRFGRITPFMCLPVIPGDSAKLSLNFGIRAMPTAFPVQTKIRADVHYFYVRNRNLWKDWPNFIGMTGKSEGYMLPKFENSAFKMDCYTDGSLADYLGVPTSITGNKSYNSPVSWVGAFTNSASSLLWHPLESSADCVQTFKPSDPTTADGAIFTCHLSAPNSPGVNGMIDKGTQVKVTLQFNGSEEELGEIATYFNRMEQVSVEGFLSFSSVQGQLVDLNCVGNPSSSYSSRVVFGESKTIDFIFTFNRRLSGLPQNPGYTYFVLAWRQSNRAPLPFSARDFDISRYSVVLPSRYEHISGKDWADGDPSALPDLNAMPFRAYESIYNAFYRDQRNNPYIVNGVHDPNVYLPTTDGGEDSHYYEWRYRNWEQDFITTAVPTPQQGIAPLVGITSSAVVSSTL